MGKHPYGTPGTNMRDAILQFLKDHWACVLLILLAFILGLFAGRFFGN